MAQQKPPVTIDGELYYPAQEFEMEIDLVMKILHSANVFSTVSLILSVAALILSILL